jgi:hypothetical protein
MPTVFDKMTLKDAQEILVLNPPPEFEPQPADQVSESKGAISGHAPTGTQARPSTQARQPAAVGTSWRSGCESLEGCPTVPDP